MAQSLASDSMHPAGKLPPTLTPTGHFSGKPTLPISRSVTLIGSRKQARLQLISSSVSTNHALIVNADSGPYIRDLASREHTIVNGIPVKEGTLSDGDEITIGRFSFRFNASPHTQPIEQVRKIRPAPMAKMEVEGSDLPVPFDGKAVLIGRRDGSDIKLLEDSVSTTHAIIFEMDGRRFIRDLASRTGTFVNGKQVHQVELQPGDEIKCGQTEMRYLSDGAVVEEGFAPPVGIGTADLGANIDDLVELDTHDAPIPMEPGGSVGTAAAAAAAAPAGTEGLELVQDEAADVEPVEINAPGLELEPLESAANVDADVEIEIEAEAEAEPEIGQPAHDELAPLPMDEDDVLAELQPLTPAPEGAAAETTAEPIDEDDLLAELQPLAPESGAGEAAAGTSEPLPLPVELEDRAFPPAAAEEDDDDIVDLATLPSALIERPGEPQEQAAEVEIEQDALSASADRTPEDFGDVDSLAAIAEAEPEPEPISAPAPESPAAFQPIEISDDIGEVGIDIEPEPLAAAETPAETSDEIPVQPAQAELDALDELALAAEDQEPAEDTLAGPAAPEPAPTANEFDITSEVQAEAAPGPAAEAEPESIAESFEPLDIAAIETAVPSAADEPTEFLPPPAPPAPIDFGGDAVGETEALPQDALEPLDASDVEVPPLDLEHYKAAVAATDALPAFDDDAVLDALDLSASAGAVAGAGMGAVAGAADETIIRSESDIAAAAEAAAEAATLEGAPKKKSKRRKKKGEPAPLAEPSGEAPAPAEPAPDAPIDFETPEPTPITPPPSRIAPPGASQWHLDPVTESELIAPTEATPESALDLDDATAAGEATAAERLHEVELTDSSFGRAVDDFTGHSTGSIVEAPAGEGEPELRPQSSSEPVTLEAIETIEGVHDDSMPSASGAFDIEAEARQEDEPAVADVGAVAGVADVPEIAEVEDVADISDIAEVAEISPARPIGRDDAPPPPAPIDEQAALELLAADAEATAQHDSPGLTLDEDRALRQPEPPPSPLLPIDGPDAASATPTSELSPPETSAADDRLFDLDLEQLGAEGAKETDPRYSVHPEDLDLADASVAGAELTPTELEDFEIVDADEPVVAEATDKPAVTAESTPDVLAELGLEPVDAEPPPPTIPPALPAAQADEHATPVEIADVEVELEPLPEPATGASAAAVATGAAGAVAASGAAAAAGEAAGATASPASAQQAPPPAQQQQPPQPGARPSPIDAFNWGANQEHFFGGTPLNLGAATGRGAQQQPAARQQPPQQQRPGGQPPPAARQPQQPPQQRQQQRPAPQQQQQSGFPQRQQQQPAPRRGRPSPFADGGAGGRGVASGFEGLAIPPANESDVFSQAPGSLTAGFDPSLMNDVFGVGGGAKNNNNPAAAGRTMPTPQPGANNNAGDAGTAPAAAPPLPPTARRATKAEPPGDSYGSGLSSADVEQQTESSSASQQAGHRGAGIPQQPLPVAEEAPQQPPKKKRRWFGLKVLVPFGLLLMAGAAGAVYNFVPVKSSVAGVVRFENFQKLPEYSRREFIKPQMALLIDENRTLRDAAKRRLASLNKTAAPGFLDDSLAYAKVATAPDIDLEAGTLSLRYVGGASKVDQDRMMALLLAVFDRNKPLLDENNELTRTVESLTREREALERTTKETKARIDELETAAQQKPDVAERTKLEADAQRLKQAYEAATANVTRLTSELKQLRENPPAPAPAPAAAAAAPATPSVASQSTENDATLQQLAGQLQQVNQQLAALQAGAMTPQAARQKLEAAAGTLRQQIEQANAAAQTNPLLQAYLTQTQETMQRIGTITDELVTRQQQPAAELATMKQQVAEKLAARRAEIAKKDPELVKLLDQRDFKTRQHNAAVEQGLTKEAADLSLELRTLGTDIAARQTMAPDDNAFVVELTSLQNRAEQTQRNLEVERAGVLQQIELLRQANTQARPPNEKLTPLQQTVAGELEKRLADVSVAGRTYASASAADAANKPADDEIRTLQALAMEIAGKIRARQQELSSQTAAATPVIPAAAQVTAAPAAAAADPQAAIEQKQRELTAAEKTRADSEAAYFAANKKVHDLKERLDQARAAGEKRDALVRQRDLAQKNLDQLVNQYELKTKLAEQKTYPATPTAADLKVDAKDDPRPMYTLIACGAVMALCVGLSFISTTSRANYASGYGFGAESYENDPNRTFAYDEEERATPVEV